MRAKCEAAAPEVPRPLGTVQGSSFLQVARDTLADKRMKIERDAPSSSTPTAPASSGAGADKKAEFASPCVGITSGAVKLESQPTPVVKYVALAALASGMSSSRHSEVKREVEAD